MSLCPCCRHRREQAARAVRIELCEECEHRFSPGDSDCPAPRPKTVPRGAGGGCLVLLCGLFVLSIFVLLFSIHFAAPSRSFS